MRRGRPRLQQQCTLWRGWRTRSSRVRPHKGCYRKIQIETLSLGCFRRLPVHRHKAGDLLDPSEPGADRWKGRQVIVALVGDMGVAVQRYVGDRELTGSEIVVHSEVIFHHLE